MPVIGYNLNIPAANNNPSQDQPKMQTNTNAINTLLSLDHYTFADNQAGRHKQVTLTNEAAPGLGGGNGVLFANLVAGQSQPFWQNALGSFQIPTIASATLADNGTVSLGGLIFKWGAVTGLSGAWPTTDQTLAYPLAFPTGTFTVYITFIGPTSSSTGDITINSKSAANFHWQFSGSSGASFGGFYWLALGN